LEMDEYFIVPKRMMENRVSQIQLNKEPPEAVEVLSLDNLTSRILKRNDISDWEKASMLTSTLERFLALKPKAFNETVPVPSTENEAATSRKLAPKRKRGRSRVPKRIEEEEEEESYHTPTAPRTRSKTKKLQSGNGKRRWIYI
jgi:hypothetical protein